MIFLIGGRGFVGSGIARALERTGEAFAILDRVNYSEYVGQRCDVLINANGNSAKLLGKKDPLADFDASVRTVRRSLIDFPCERYVHFSSCDVYPDCSSPATTGEEQALEVTRQSPYGFHKYIAEECVRHAARNWLIFRLGGFVGPGLKKNAIFDILKGGPLWLDPESELQFLHTDSAAEVALDLMRRTIAGEVFNLCGNGTIQLREAIEEAGLDVTVSPGSPRVRYDVNIAKISKYANVPATKDAVLAFVRSEAKLRRTE